MNNGMLIWTIVQVALQKSDTNTLHNLVLKHSGKAMRSPQTFPSPHFFFQHEQTLVWRMFRDSVSIEAHCSEVWCMAWGGNVKHVQQCGQLLGAMYQQIPEMYLHTNTRRGKLTGSWILHEICHSWWKHVNLQVPASLWRGQWIFYYIFIDQSWPMNLKDKASLMQL